MEKFIVEGKNKLSGTINVAGNKNEALPLIAAALLQKGTTILHNVPDIGDVRAMTAIAKTLGTTFSWENGQLIITSSTISNTTLPLTLSRKIRASILFASALLIRTGNAIITQPGGDTIGRRRLDTHFLVFREMGAQLRVERNNSQETRFILEAPNGLHGSDIYLDEASVTATENAIIAAAGARGKTTINNAACEPHVQGLCRFLELCGVIFTGIGSNVLIIEGVSDYPKTISYTVGPDYIEAGSLIGLAAATQSALTITGIQPLRMRMILLQYERIGVQVESNIKNQTIFIPSNQSMTIKKDFGTSIPRIEDSPWPGFPTDLMSILLVTATQSDGTCLIHEKMFESRLYFVDELINMGAQIVLCDPHRAVIVGPSPLYGGAINSPDIRAGMGLLIAALAADGISTIYNISQIDRGYERIDERLTLLGASIKRYNE